MIHGSVFSGIGGFDLAAEWMGWENVFHCENNVFCQRILKREWPNAKSYGDITKTDFTIWKGHIDVLTGGFPCQPFSISGQRNGIKDDRYLWPEMLRAIEETNCYWVVGENVIGINSMELENCCADLERIGFEVQPFNISACCTGINQDRKRTWIVAYNNGRERKEPYKRKIMYSKKPQVDAFQPELISVRNRINNGFPKGMDECKRIKALANAVVPQVAYEIFKAIEQISE